MTWGDLSDKVILLNVPQFILPKQFPVKLGGSPQKGPQFANSTVVKRVG